MFLVFILSTATAFGAARDRNEFMFVIAAGFAIVSATKLLNPRLRRRYR